MKEMPKRGFDCGEFEGRLLRFQEGLREKGVDGVFLTTEAEVEYFSGFRSQFWESPTRPWFLVVPGKGKPIAVIPEIGLSGFEETWLEDVRSWSSPCPEDDGVSVLAGVLKEVSVRFGRVGALLGAETYLRMPMNNFRRLEGELGGVEVVDVSAEMRCLRAVKSEREIEKIGFACEVTYGGFDFLRKNLRKGMTEREVCRGMEMEMLRLGGDRCPYVVSGSGEGGYGSIIMGPSDRVLGEGDVLVVDVGVKFDGYCSDFDRNFGFGEVGEESERVYGVLYDALEEGLRGVRAGVTTGDVWSCMNKVLERGGGFGNSVGRMGHGLGMELTEYPSLVEGGDVELREGMVLTLEPSMVYGEGKMMVHEENLVVREGGCELLHERTWRELPRVES